MPSFDVASSPNMVEINNAVTNTIRNIGLRFDFKGTSAAAQIEGHEITLTGDAPFQINQLEDVLLHKMAKRNVDARFLKKGKVAPAAGGTFKLVFEVKNGMTAEEGKRVQKVIKDSKLKLQAAIQGDQVRVSGAKKDDLVAAMRLLREQITDLPIAFENLRD
ncbi:MAG: YajQ family cyclic di-GMP-binding protein [Burkholderiaceae bacterium]|nr:MAG: YajQ family cyclic di-GMP-binding protein [Burkholderiaceae bacterium]